MPNPVVVRRRSEPAYRRAARLTDGLIFSGALDRILDGWQRVQQLLAEYGRAREEFGAEYLISQAIDPQGARDIARRWQDAGTHLGIRTIGHGFQTTEQHIDHLASVKQQLG